MTTPKRTDHIKYRNMFVQVIFSLLLWGLYT
jgi:hypothetical protein